MPVKITERELEVNKSDFFVGKKEILVRLRYNTKTGMSHYTCARCCSELCRHVILVKGYVRRLDRTPSVRNISPV